MGRVLMTGCCLFVGVQEVFLAIAGAPATSTTRYMLIVWVCIAWIWAMAELDGL